MRSYNSHGQTIEVTPRLFGLFLWIACGLEVRVGDRVFLPKMDRLSLYTSTEFDFDAEGKRVKGVVRSLAPVWFIPRLSYSVTVDGLEIAKDTQMISRWPLMYIGWLLVAAIVFFTIIGAGVFIFFLRRVSGS